jgi:16S rRNA (cytosine1402-N4)-methyltransferase
MEGHVPVLRQEIIESLRCRSGSTYLDCTAGYGGHTEAILQASGPNGRVVAVDRDPEAIAALEQRLRAYTNRVHLIHGNFRQLRAHLRAVGLEEVDGVIFDLGVSSTQLDRPERGFSFTSDGPLDMRMDRSDGPTAADLVHAFSEGELADVFYQYGEERYARRIARAIVRARTRAPVRTTQELVSIIRGAVPAFYRHGRIHFATRVFQALRIAVNGELDELEAAFRDAAAVLRPGGRLGIISFHSLEDRKAKHSIRSLSSGDHPLLRPVTKKPVVSSEAERQQNPRARSAKLRVAERI